MEEMKTKRGFWYYWAKALGEKAHKKCNKTSDKIAVIRTLITLQILITNFFIIANAIRHWNDIEYSQKIEYSVKENK